MKKRLAKSATRIMLSGSILAGTFVVPGEVKPVIAAEAQQASSIYIAPIDKAKFLAGSIFDFRVELNNLTSMPKTVTIKINGEDAQKVIGKNFVKTNTDKSEEYTIREVTFKTPGNYTVSVEADGMKKSVTYEVVQADLGGKKAKNVIFFVGDGLSLPVLTAARILSKGNTEGKYNDLLETEKMAEVSGFVNTSGMDSIATDSANSASAYNTGHKTVVNAMGSYPDNTEDTLDDPSVETLAEIVKRAKGMSVGVVSTAEIEDATPAAVVGHTRRRSDYVPIVDQFYKLQPEVILGGGSATFLPQSVPGSKRKDEKDFFQLFEQSGYQVVENATQLKNVSGDTKKLLGLFHTGNMDVYYDRSTKNEAVLKGFNDQPTLWDMTEKAIEVLSKNENGFFLMVEGGSIDKQLHPLDWERGVMDAIEMDKAVGVAKRFADKNGETLIVVTGDHAHSMSIGGTYWEGDGKSGKDAARVYEEAKFPSYYDGDGDGFPDTLDVDRKLFVGFGIKPDYYEDYRMDPVPTSPAVKNKDGDYVANSVKLANPQDPNKDRFLQVGNLNASTGVHTVDDVPILAGGPGAKYFKNTIDNTEVFFGFANALGLNLTGAKNDGQNWITLREAAATIGATVKYDAASGQVQVMLGDNTIRIIPSSGKASKNGKDIALDVKFENGATYVSNQFLLELLAK
ncbi:alkaline phosphatase [Paenibacillus puerhi]|uniref:alkaline phosphatase n=1 Tax=Paenibacillus puerhi TaxID=2692622 RepID=UPI001F43D1D4|nr:alkaline phosphatase [Paenibacillus puerhi]